jgi:hypothetical protein
MQTCFTGQKTMRDTDTPRISTDPATLRAFADDLTRAFPYGVSAMNNAAYALRAIAAEKEAQTAPRVATAEDDMHDAIDRSIAPMLDDRWTPAEKEAQAAPGPDDDYVDRFAVAMKAKLARAREKGRSGWQDMDAVTLSRMLWEHVEKGERS